MKLALGAGLALLWAASCASYDPAVDYRSQLAPFAEGTGPRLVASDFAVPEPFLPPSFPSELVAETSLERRLEASMVWLGNHLSFDGSVFPPQPLTAPVIWKAALEGHGLNCLAAATLAASVFQAQGFPSRLLSLYSRDPSNENHVVVLVWHQAEARWIVADPSYRTLFYNQDGRTLGPLELRELIAAGRAPRLSTTASWNADPVEPNYLHYLSKNLYRWSVPGAFVGRIQVTPAGYFGWGLPFGFATVVHDPRSFLTPP